jgi:GntR family transcriptional regulator, uxu operon transcriptional repressor
MATTGNTNIMTADPGRQPAKRTAAAAPAGPEDGPLELRPYQLVAERVRQFVRNAGIPAGGRLPAERILASMLGVSRASLREALIALELGGFIDVRGGSGLYLGAAPDSAARVPEAGPGPFEVLSARRLIEPEAAAMAARVATEAAIDALRAAAAELERHQHDKAGCERADRAFHRAIARATGNSALLGVVEYLWDQRGRLTFALEELFETEEQRKEAQSDHWRIV